ncbi:1162_t:CDS:2 [Diversispora eburnea]|uniref:1162_t:CDS:1 n=1 Tax=Diversispora eburnea TaxID=1213867 RepID=A0A9N8ZJ12_9GLOM|nr:1162_t:CDS:2 [Diversispora eburnea]
MSNRSNNYTNNYNTVTNMNNSNLSNLGRKWLEPAQLLPLPPPHLPTRTIKANQNVNAAIAASTVTAKQKLQQLEQLEINSTTITAATADQYNKYDKYFTTTINNTTQSQAARQQQALNIRQLLTGQSL